MAIFNRLILSSDQEPSLTVTRILALFTAIEDSVNLQVVGQLCNKMLFQFNTDCLCNLMFLTFQYLPPKRITLVLVHCNFYDVDFLWFFIF